MILRNTVKYLIIILMIFNCTNTFASKLKDIKISGNKRVNTETIIIFSDVNIGDEINNIDLNDTLKKLYETDFFEDINIKIENNVLLVNVKENLIIQNLLFRGIKSKEFLKELKKKINIKEKNPYVDNNIKTELEKIKKILQASGYYFSNVKLSKKENNNNTIDLIFDIDLGEKAFIKKINFIGDKKFKKRKLLNVIASEEDKFWKFISQKKLLNNQRLELDKRLLKNFYKNKGYYDVEIISDTVKYQDDQNFEIVFNIDSGKKYNFGKFEFNIPDNFDEIYFKEISNELSEFSGEVYSFKIIEKILEKIEDIASQNSYEFVDAIIDETKNENNIDVSINLKEEVIKKYISKINIEGNQITIEDVVRNELIIDEGDPLNNILYNKSISNIRSLGIFENVESQIKDTDDEFSKEIDIIVSEKATGEVTLGAGVGSSGTSTAFGVKENNFLGQGIKLNTNLTLSTETIKGLFSYTKPNFNNSDRDLSLTAESSETDRLKDYGYKTNNTGFSAGTRFEYYEDLFVAPSFSTQYESIKTSSTASSLLKKQEGSYFDIEGFYALDFDKRNQSFQPSAGYLTTFTQKIPFNIEDDQTIVNSYEFTSYHEYIDDVVASISFFGSNANSFGDDDVRISDRLYLPSKKLRGFEKGKIGPVDNGDFVGGNYLAAFNITSELPIFPALETMDFNVFYDAANVWGVDYSSAIDDSNGIRSSTGIAVDWYTPIGPLSFSLAQPILKESTDKTETFRFSLGTTF